MTNFKTAAIVGSSALLLFAATAHAGETKTPKDVQSKVTTTEKTEVLSASTAKDNLIPVTDENGDVYYNHYVAADELFDASADLETVDTYTVEYNGRTYTNKIVVEDK